VNMLIKTRYHLILVCLALSLMVGCTTPTAPPVTNGDEPSYQEHPSSDSSSGPPDRVEVVYFHRAQRCRKCLYAEAGTRYTLETYFEDELASGKLNFKVLNVEDEENAAVVDKYGDQHDKRRHWPH
jgi:hypothetical protein